MLTKLTQRVDDVCEKQEDLMSRVVALEKQQVDQAEEAKQPGDVEAMINTQVRTVAAALLQPTLDSITEKLARFEKVAELVDRLVMKIAVLEKR